MARKYNKKRKRASQTKTSAIETKKIKTKTPSKLVLGIILSIIGLVMFINHYYMSKGSVYLGIIGAIICAIGVFFLFTRLQDWVAS